MPPPLPNLSLELPPYQPDNTAKEAAQLAFIALVDNQLVVVEFYARSGVSDAVKAAAGALLKSLGGRYGDNDAIAEPV